MTISVIDPIPRALAYTKRVLFQPFDLGKWFVIGFTAFLALLSDGGGGGGGYNVPTGHGQHRIGGDQVITFIADHALVIGVIVVLAILVIIGINAVLLWLGCRGKFMFLDNVACNRAEIVAPWKRFRALGNSLWTLKLLLAVLTLLLVMGIILGAVALAWRDIVDRVFGAAAWQGIIVGGSLLLLVGLTAWVFKVFVGDFVVPVMYVRAVSVWTALRVFASELLLPHLGKFVLCFLLMFAVNIAFSVALLLACLLTCCIGCCIVSIPYIGIVALLPMIVYDRAYTLYFLEQFGPQWRVIQPAAAAPVA